MDDLGIACKGSILTQGNIAFHSLISSPDAKGIPKKSSGGNAGLSAGSSTRAREVATERVPELARGRLDGVLLCRRASSEEGDVGLLSGPASGSALDDSVDSGGGESALARANSSRVMGCPHDLSAPQITTLVFPEPPAYLLKVPEDKRHGAGGRACQWDDSTKPEGSSGFGRREGDVVAFKWR